MSSRIYDFDDCKKIGLKAENIILENFNKIFKPILHKLVKAKKIVYVENDKDSVEKQKKGIDGQVLLNYDVKSLSHKYKKETRILLETVSVIEKDIPGWLFTNESDVIVLVYWDDKEKTQFYKGFLLFPKILRKWYPKNKGEYKEKKITSKKKDEFGREHYWETAFILVPENELPKKSYKAITSDLFSKQENMTLSSFFKNLQEETSFDNLNNLSDFMS